MVYIAPRKSAEHFWVMQRPFHAEAYAWVIFWNSWQYLSIKWMAGIYNYEDVIIIRNSLWQTYSRVGFPANSILQPATWSVTRLLQWLSLCFPFSSTGWDWGRKCQATTPIKIQSGSYIASRFVSEICAPNATGIPRSSLKYCTVVTWRAWFHARAWEKVLKAFSLEDHASCRLKKQLL